MAFSRSDGSFFEGELTESERAEILARRAAAADAQSAYAKVKIVCSWTERGASGATREATANHTCPYLALVKPVEGERGRAKGTRPIFGSVRFTRDGVALTPEDVAKLPHVMEKGFDGKCICRGNFVSGALWKYSHPEHGDWAQTP